MLKFPCLVLDHDDTVVQSETTINYPYFCYILDQFRPGTTITLEAYTQGCCNLGFTEMCRQNYGFSDEELQEEYKGWKEYIRSQRVRASKNISGRDKGSDKPGTSLILLQYCWA